ncbi:MAG: cytochrome c biogenesis protein ResB [Oscillibacter sp.]|nr:cytochrome c biogenesis protein ResB [Oscillibacter sp.]
MTKAKTIRKFLSSMRFAIFLLILLAAYCALASLVTQGQTYAWYAAHYSERTAALILTLHLDDAFHSLLFILINALLILSLLSCNLVRFPSLYRRAIRDAVPAPNAACDAEAIGIQDPDAVFHAFRMPRPRRVTAEDGRELLYAVKNRAGIWGAWICHLGMLLLILGFSLGQITHEEYALYGVPGQTRLVGETGLAATIDDFRVELRDDDTVEQYTADITVTDGTRKESASVSVNNPARLFGLTFYQNSTGWAADVDITKDGEPLQREILCAGEYLGVADKPELVVYFNAFYPDYELVPGEGPRTRSGQLNNPGYLYSVYYMGQVLGMNVLMSGEELTIDEYTVTFSNPQSYTLIQAKRDSFAWLALLGGLIATLGLFLAFYIRPVTLWAVREESGWTVRGRSRKGGVLFREEFSRVIGDAGQVNYPDTGQTENQGPEQVENQDTENQSAEQTENQNAGQVEHQDAEQGGKPDTEQPDNPDAEQGGNANAER